MNLKSMFDDVDAGWRDVLGREFESDYMVSLSRFLEDEQSQGKVIYPDKGDLFRTLLLTPLDKVRVVILGQDPYHGAGQAHGLCFSVAEGVKPPPSLVNIYKELESDLGMERPSSGFLENWSQQGVLLLNSVLSVEAEQAASHSGKGWEHFTDAVIRAVNEKDEPVVFMLWGAYAQKKAAFVDESRHLVLKASHPSPLSAYRGFLGCKHFSKANNFLSQHGGREIDWSVC